MKKKSKKLKKKEYKKKPVFQKVNNHLINFGKNNRMSLVNIINCL